MSDVRSLLRNERVARRVNHPQAQYTSAGILVCKACQSQIKSDALWPSHLSSSQHINTLKRLAAGLKSQKEASKGTKRKADDDDDDAIRGEALTVRKRARADETDTISAIEEPRQAPSPPDETLLTTEKAAAEPPLEKVEAQNVIDEDEWAAFERDVATPPPEHHANISKPILADAIISAAPMTAAELAARSREETSVQAKERRQAETEGEKEDAQRRLEEEFDQMEELEERVKRLKDKREALRQQTRAKRDASPEIENKEILASERVGSVVEGNESDYDDDEDDDWDNWGA